MPGQNRPRGRQPLPFGAQGAGQGRGGRPDAIYRQDEREAVGRERGPR
ncbi:hypothetical protein [Lysobacter gummosus]